MSSSQWNEIIEGAATAKSVDDIHKICVKLCQQLGFEQFLYGVQFPNSFVKSHIVIISAYCPEWFSHYEAMGYMKADPTILHCQTQILPLCWDEVDFSANENGKIARQIMTEAREFGLKSGFCIPVHGANGEVAVLSFASSVEPGKAKARILEGIPYAQFCSGFIHEAANRVLNASQLLLTKDTLTRREKECLLWAAEGKTAWETSQILDVAERTVNFHLQNATAKLNVSNRAHAVARAISQHLILPQLA
ncbi:MAG: LuxR family transcriptional regulator [Gammaproteobacteria bacterium]